MEEQYGSGAYGLRGITLTHGEGARIFDDEGNSYVDCVAGHGAAILGHAHPVIVDAMHEQSQRLMACSNSFSNDQRARLLERLIHNCNHLDDANFSRAFLTNSGTEAVEAALKLARHATGRSEIIATMRCFHGRTFGSLSLTWRKKYRKPFEPLVPDVNHIPLNNIEAAQEAITEETAAVVVEPVQGEGGVIPADSAYLEALREQCDETGTLLIFDEIQTGFGRTGEWFAFQHHNVVPDVLTLAKGIAGGFPMGAMVFRESVEPFSNGIHGSTFGGNPLASAVSLATMGILEEQNLPARSKELGAKALEYLSEELEDTQIIRGIRGFGLMIGIELRRRVTPVLKELMERGILALPAGSTILRFLPPLNIPEEEWEFVLEETVAILQDRTMPTRKASEQG
ncbi:MAG: aspartate aminotransferase family protein [Candidatus Marinimicrobia bacterium]|nr:aspartate aminotransferase family protein [Candidatus Neomarinimicrobiota bacterium]MCF7830018.1 aspartate aminotransferase family protein [Candidatus Neomarinimicrobiota bacterium]MCF7881940.1 aspartate aminotransferase family protein [Candidatus Neomarinimicrobiota bacterium]